MSALRSRSMLIMNSLTWLVFIAAALLEVGGDAVIRRGLRGRSAVCLVLGCATLAGYGLVVNSVKWDFSKLLGVYVGFFAATSILFGRFVLQETIPLSTLCGLVLILMGGLLIQFGRW
jgi:drug/metabolite transporter superfamily protein YnfA